MQNDTLALLKKKNKEAQSSSAQLKKLKNIATNGELGFAITWDASQNVVLADQEGAFETFVKAYASTFMEKVIQQPNKVTLSKILSSEASSDHKTLVDHKKQLDAYKQALEAYAEKLANAGEDELATLEPSLAIAKLAKVALKMPEDKAYHGALTVYEKQLETYHKGLEHYKGQLQDAEYQAMLKDPFVIAFKAALLAQQQGTGLNATQENNTMDIDSLNARAFEYNATEQTRVSERLARRWPVYEKLLRVVSSNIAQTNGYSLSKAQGYYKHFKELGRFIEDDESLHDIKGTIKPMALEFTGSVSAGSMMHLFGATIDARDFAAFENKDARKLAISGIYDIAGSLSKKKLSQSTEKLKVLLAQVHLGERIVTIRLSKSDDHVEVYDPYHPCDYNFSAIAEVEALENQIAAFKDQLNITADDLPDVALDCLEEGTQALLEAEGYGDLLASLTSIEQQISYLEDENVKEAILKKAKNHQSSINAYALVVEGLRADFTAKVGALNEARREGVLPHQLRLYRVVRKLHKDRPTLRTKAPRLVSATQGEQLNHLGTEPSHSDMALWSTKITQTLLRHEKEKGLPDAAERRKNHASFIEKLLSGELKPENTTAALRAGHQQTVLDKIQLKFAEAEHQIERLCTIATSARGIFADLQGKSKIFENLEEKDIKPLLQKHCNNIAAYGGDIRTLLLKTSPFASPEEFDTLTAPYRELLAPIQAVRQSQELGQSVESEEAALAGLDQPLSVLLEGIEAFEAQKEKQRLESTAKVKQPSPAQTKSMLLITFETIINARGAFNPSFMEQIKQLTALKAQTGVHIALISPRACSVDIIDWLRGFNCTDDIIASLNEAKNNCSGKPSLTLFIKGLFKTSHQ